MNDPVLQFPCIVEIVSPLHIGNGERLGWTSMIASGSDLYVIDERKLFSVVNENANAAAAFVAYMETSQPRISDYLTRYQIAFDRVSAYTVTLSGATPNREVLPFIKSTEFFPYVPGSSLKGAMRTAFLQTVLQNHKFQRLVQADVLVRSKKGQAKYADDDMEQRFFGPEPHRDWMRVLQIADTDAINSNALNVVEVQTLSVSGIGLRPKSFSIYPEVLLPGRTLRTSVTLNMYLLLDKTVGTVLNVNRAKVWTSQFVERCNRAAKEMIEGEIAFYQRYHETQLQHWYQHLAADLQDFSDRECLLWMGWGSGYESQGTLRFFDTGTQEQLRLNYELGKIVHQVCGMRVRHARRPKGSMRWYCRECGEEVDDRDVKLVAPFPKSRKVALTETDHRTPLGWIKLRI
ncbi:MAG: type III-A CRISPR-associated RAMP protein Csm5 [Anaerolineae bacterium]|nr:type III-A CRISPR-associated RAMP protein Csm5 [Anaerolineae bacterium]